MSEKITLFNFDNAYTYQDFYLNEIHQWLNFTDLSGVSGYCDEESLEIIRRRIATSEPTRINYIDSGNYHYITYLLLERLREPFSLILFDHHTDMQPSLFENLMSCGCWVKRTLDENPFLKEVIIIGVADQLIKEIPSKYSHKVFAYGESMLKQHPKWQTFAKEHIHYNVYISVDKDVMDAKEACTNWDQGFLTLSQLREIYESIVETHEILSIDICGEYAPNMTCLMETEQLLNNKANLQILQLIEEVAATKEGENT